MMGFRRRGMLVSGGSRGRSGPGVGASLSSGFLSAGQSSVQTASGDEDRRRARADVTDHQTQQGLLLPILR